MFQQLLAAIIATQTIPPNSFEWHTDMVEMGYEQAEISFVLKEQVLPTDKEFAFPMAKSNLKCKFEPGTPGLAKLNCVSIELNMDCKKMIHQPDRVFMTVNLPSGRFYQLRIWCQAKTTTKR